MLDALEVDYFNPSSLHTPGFLVRQKIEKCRKNILSLLGANGFDCGAFGVGGNISASPSAVCRLQQPVVSHTSGGVCLNCVLNYSNGVEFC